jgi:GT2 family glycosyltransferase
MKPFTGTHPVDILPGCAMAFRRTVLEHIRFSEFFSGYAQGEDVEMSLRVGRQWRLVCCGDAWVVHKLSPVARPGSFRKGRMEVRNRFFICKRHSPGSPADRMRFWLDVIFLILMDLAWFSVRPWRPNDLAHAAGLGAAALECLASPPVYEEPALATRYQLSTIN